MLLEAMLLCLYAAAAYVRFITWPVRWALGYRY